jgi:heme-degrading monooxygenase HmoA
MIARIWRGAVPAARRDEYAAYMEETGLKDYAATPGNRGVWMLARDEGEQVEFMMLTLWESWDALRAFAGEDVEKAVYYARDRAFLTRLDEKVEHFEVLRHIDRAGR